MRSVLILFLSIIAISSFAQKEGYLSVQDVAQFRKDFAVQNAKISSVKSTFVQEKTLTMLTEKIVSSGEFSFKRSDKVRIEYKTPYHYLLIINGDQMITKDSQKESHVNTSSNKLFRQINRIIIDCVQGTILNSKDFTVKVSENQSSFLVQLTPQAKTIREFFQTISITLDKSDYAVAQLELLEQGGDTTLMRFSNRQLNTKIDDAVFSIR